MNDMDNMRVFADQLWKYMVPKLNAAMASNVSYFRARVVSNPGGGMLEVQRPLDDATLTLPCIASVAHAQPGQQVTALVMGSLSNAIVVGDGKMNVPLSVYGPSSTVTLESGDGGMPFRKLVSDIVAVQTGSGDPSPDNVRPINGFTEMNLHLNDSVFNVSFGSAGTVYGGTLDLLTGVLTVTHLCVSFDGTENWYIINNPDNIRYYVNVTTGVNCVIGSDIYSHTVCNPNIRTAAYSKEVYYGARMYTLSITGVIRMIICLPNMPTTKEDFQAMLSYWSSAGTPLQIMYELETPITYQLVPQRISSLSGQNTIWSDTGDVTVEYGQFLQALQQEIENM